MISSISQRSIEPTRSHVASPMLASAKRPFQRFLRYGVVSALIGVGVVTLLSVNADVPLSLVLIQDGIIMGLAIGMGSILMELCLLRPLLRLGLRPILLARCASYFLGGAAGVLVGLFFRYGTVALDAMSQSRQLLASMGLYGGVAVAVGLVFHTVETLQTSVAEKDIELRDKEIAERELATARLIQKRLMPPENAEGVGFRLAAKNRAASVVAGDFYDYFHLPDGSMGFAIADVAGKGIGASLQMATVKAMLPLVAAARAASDNPVAGTLDDLNERLCGELGPREFVALSYGRYDVVAGTMEFANAGLPDPYWIPDGRDCGERVVALSVEGERLPLGIRRGIRYQSQRVNANEPGTMLLLTDGLVERSVDDGPLGYQRFEELLAKMETASDIEAWLGQLQEQLDRASGDAPEDDDCTTMAIRCEPPAERMRLAPVARESILSIPSQIAR